MRRLAYMAACGVVLAGPALADSEYKRECRWEHGRYLCEAEYKSPYRTTTTECLFEPGGKNECETTTKRRPAPEPPRPVLPPSAERTPSGVVIMRGMPTR